MLNSLRSKYVSLLFAIVVFVTSILTVSLLLSVKQASEKSSLANSREINFRLYQSSELLVTTLSSQLAANLTNPLYHLDMAAIQDLLEVAAGYPEIIEAVVFDQDGLLIHDGTLYIKSFGDAINVNQQQLAHILRGDALLNREHNLIRYYQPILIGNEVIGVLYLSFSLELVNNNVAELKQLTAEQLSSTLYEILINAAIILVIGLALGGFLVWLAMGLLNHPIQQLVNQAKAVARGDFSHRVHLYRKDELGKLSRELNHMADKLEAHDQNIRDLAFNDPLTGLPNRRSFRNSLKQAFAQSKRTNEVFAILFIDIDGFKEVNDAFGHSGGDQVLVEIAARIKLISRDADLVAKNASDGQPNPNKLPIKTERPLLSRLGGDEFIILLRNLTSPADAAIVATRLIHTITKPIVLEKGSLSTSCSIGIATFPNDAKTEQELMNHADTAMYSVKTSGKNNFKFFSQEMTEQPSSTKNSELTVEPPATST